jgi:predicted MPP superfamily phosphohydrolase
VQEHEIVLPGWAASSGSLRIAVLADLHTGSPHNDLKKLAEVVHATNHAQPDLILLAGDFVIHGMVGGEFVEPELSASVLKDLHAPLGVFAILGNHDWWFDPTRVQSALETAGIEVLEDQSRSLRFKNTHLWLVGVSDYWEGPHNIKKALSGVNGTAPVILFTHNPDIFPEIPASVSLTIAGHTHGGQVAIPLVGRPIVPSKYGERYAIGHVIEGGRHLFVTPGIGTSIVPVRFRVPPEISLVKVQSTERHDALTQVFARLVNDVIHDVRRLFGEARSIRSS